MTCKEFKDKVVDLFDKDVDIQTKTEYETHMAECSACKRYYEEMTQAFNVLRPQTEPGKKSLEPKLRKRRHNYWQIAAAMAIFFVGVLTGAGHLFSTSVSATGTEASALAQAINCVQNVGSFSMKVFVRTTPNENFSYFHPDSDFVKVDVKMLCQNDSAFYRVEKENGRTVVCDGTYQYLWIPGVLYQKGSLKAGFLDKFGRFLYPKSLLALQEASVKLYKEEKVTRTESDSIITLTVEGLERNQDLKQLLEDGKMGVCPVTIENQFSKHDGLLRNVRVWVMWKGRKVLILHTDNIVYNVMLSRESLTTLPGAAESKWQNVDKQFRMSSNRLKKLQREAPEQAARRILTALTTGKTESAKEALESYRSNLTILKKNFQGCTISDFVARRAEDYPGVYVFYRLTMPDGKISKNYIAIRNDNEQHIWQADGGL